MPEAGDFLLGDGVEKSSAPATFLIVISVIHRRVETCAPRARRPFLSEVGVAFLGVKNKEGFLRVLVQTRSGHLPKKHPFWKLVLECAKTGWEEGLFGPLFNAVGKHDDQA